MLSTCRVSFRTSRASTAPTWIPCPRGLVGRSSSLSIIRPSTGPCVSTGPSSPTARASCESTNGVPPPSPCASPASPSSLAQRKNPPNRDKPGFSLGGFFRGDTTKKRKQGSQGKSPGAARASWSGPSRRPRPPWCFNRTRTSRCGPPLIFPFWRSANSTTPPTPSKPPPSSPSTTSAPLPSPPPSASRPSHPTPPSTPSSCASS
mmetsp:Transcript_355/g.1044  ORF Transcript_355/g.1044 Transcript_355/m.1044 type:complete len:205 (+) Transcript_355:711-1325(+)